MVATPPRQANGRFASFRQSEPDVTLAAATKDTGMEELVAGFVSSDPRLDIWRRYPDITDDENDETDDWACGEVSAQFVVWARSQGWDAETVTAQADDPWADEHVWVALSHEGKVTAVDFTARQYHNLAEISRDPKVLGASWPLAWDPAASPAEHPFMGSFQIL